MVKFKFDVGKTVASLLREDIGTPQKTTRGQSSDTAGELAENDVPDLQRTNKGDDQGSDSKDTYISCAGDSNDGLLTYTLNDPMFSSTPFIEARWSDARSARPSSARFVTALEEVPNSDQGDGEPTEAKESEDHSIDDETIVGGTPTVRSTIPKGISPASNKTDEKLDPEFIQKDEVPLGIFDPSKSDLQQSLVIQKQFVMSRGKKNVKLVQVGDDGTKDVENCSHVNTDNEASMDNPGNFKTGNGSKVKQALSKTPSSKKKSKISPNPIVSDGSVLGSDEEPLSQTTSPNRKCMKLGCTNSENLPNNLIPNNSE